MIPMGGAAASWIMAQCRRTQFYRGWELLLHYQGHDITLASPYSFMGIGCSLVYLGSIKSIGGMITDEGGNFEGDPSFCRGKVCWTAPDSTGDYAIADTSICLPNRNSCGTLVGANGVGCGVTGVQEQAEGAGKTQVAPIPASASISIAVTGGERVEIVDVLGRRVWGAVLEHGRDNHVEWNLRDDRGSRVPNGAICRCDSQGDQKMTRICIVQ